MTLTLITRCVGDLKQRLGHRRRLFAYTHPALPEEPLVFVQVALTAGLADDITEILEADTSMEEDASEAATAAMFYSISSTQEGLRGIDLGNFLIKRVVGELKRDHENLEHFCTLSPIPGFRAWQMSLEENEFLETGEKQKLEALVGDKSMNTILEEDEWHMNAELREILKPVLMRLGHRYLFETKKKNTNYAIDPVSNFHIRNGARLERLNWLADVSPKGLQQSRGLMVNYYYHIEAIEANSHAYLSHGHITVGTPFEESGLEFNCIEGQVSTRLT